MNLMLLHASSRSHPPVPCSLLSAPCTASVVLTNLSFIGTGVGGSLSNPLHVSVATERLKIDSLTATCMSMYVSHKNVRSDRTTLFKRLKIKGEPGTGLFYWHFKGFLNHLWSCET